MRVSPALFRQHIGRMFKTHWRIQGKRVPIETDAEAHLKTLGVKIFDSQEVVKEVRKEIKLDIVGRVPKPVVRDQTHPDWHDKVCYFHRDDNVLLSGLDQAKKITKTVEVEEGLPNISLPELSKENNERIQELIMASHIFDTEQKKLPKVKDPERPAWNFPRTYGITCQRVFQLLITKLIQECELLSPKMLVNDRIILEDAVYYVPIMKEGEHILLEMSAEQVLMSKKPLSKITKEIGENLALPELYPIHHLNTLVPENIYKFEDLYPQKNTLKYHPHTVFLTYDTTKVKNIYEEEVTEPQILGRSLMKTFTVAASYARSKFGKDIKVLPEPVTLQCVQTDGRVFHFGMFQLNTLDLDGEGAKNIWYHIPRLSLFSSCGYKSGIPTLEEYNSDVVKYLLAFYKNV